MEIEDKPESLGPFEILIGATVPSGFESVAKDECFDKFGSEAREQRGRIHFPVSLHNLQKVKELRAIDNIFVVVAEYSELELEQEKEKVLQLLCQKAVDADWRVPLLAWKNFTSSECCISIDHASNIEELQAAAQETPEKSCDVEDSAVIKSTESTDTLVPTWSEVDINCLQEKNQKAKKMKTLPDNLPSFRVTCNRVGKNHQFGSPDAACSVGGVINDVFHWPVKMKNYDIEVLLNIIENTATLGIALTAESLFKRNIQHFGPTTLRSNICYSMIRLSKPKPGEILCDPMCGGGSIPLEGAMAWPSLFHIGADMHSVAVKHARANMEAITKNKGSKERSIPMDVLQWDCTNLPLRPNSVDIIISDLPFGKRMGKRVDNWDLYYRALVKMARIAHPQTGRAVLLTQDKKCMAHTLQKLSHLWYKSRQVHINLGGLRAFVYVLHCMKGRKPKQQSTTKNTEGIDEAS